MAKSEPTLVPEWLKGAAGQHSSTSSGIFSHTDNGYSRRDFRDYRDQEPSQRQSYGPLGRRTSGDRGPSNVYPSFGRGHGRGEEWSHDERERDRDHWGERRGGGRGGSVERSFRDVDRDRDIQRTFTGYAHGHERDQHRDYARDTDRSRLDRSVSERVDREHKELDRSLQRTISNRHEVEPVHRRHSVSAGVSRILEEVADRKSDMAAIPTAMPASSGSLASTMQKAAFERNFPSLGGQERMYSHAVTTTVSSPATSNGLPRALWQSTPRSLSNGKSLGILAGGLGSGEWNSKLADVPPALAADLQQSAAVSSPSTVSQIPSTSTTSVPKMADALQMSVEKTSNGQQSAADLHRLEELALRQSRQLIPMKPSLPKNLSQGLLRDKGKSKTLRPADDNSIPSSHRTTTSTSTARSVTDSSRFGAKPLTRARSGKELVGSFSLNGMRRDDTIFIAAKQAPASTGTFRGAPVLQSRPVSVTVVADDKDRAVALDRSAFFNSLRRKSLTSPPSPHQQVSLSNGGIEQSIYDSGGETLLSPVGEANGGCEVFSGEELAAEGEDAQQTFLSAALAQNPRSLSSVDELQALADALPSSEGNGAAGSMVSPAVGVTCNGPVLANGTGSFPTANGDGGYGPQLILGNGTVSGLLNKRGEEEEAAFLRSLGWNEDDDEDENGEGGLTEEEIKQFHKEKLKAVQSMPSLSKGRPSLSFSNFGTGRVGIPRAPVRASKSFVMGARKDMPIGSVGSVSSGLSTSDSDSD